MSSDDLKRSKSEGPAAASAKIGAGVGVFNGVTATGVEPEEARDIADGATGTWATEGCSSAGGVSTGFWAAHASAGVCVAAGCGFTTRATAGSTAGFGSWAAGGGVPHNFLISCSAACSREVRSVQRLWSSSRSRLRRLFVRIAKIHGPNRTKSTAANAAKPKKISSIRARVPGAKELCRSARFY